MALKKLILIMTKSSSTGLRKLLWQAKMLKLQKTPGDGKKTSRSPS